MYDCASQVKNTRDNGIHAIKRMRETVLDAEVLSGCGRVEVSEDGIETGQLKWIMYEEFL